MLKLFNQEKSLLEKENVQVKTFLGYCGLIDRDLSARLRFTTLRNQF